MGDARSQKVSRSVDHDDNRRWALFLDFDGTLVDIAERPDAVCIDPILPAVLAQLRNGLDGALALVSGRPVATLDLLLAPFNSDAAGIHGGEWRYRGEYHRVCSEMDDGLRGVVHDLRAAARQLDDVIVEDKGASVAVHWRLAPHHEQAVRDVVATCFARLGSAFRCQSGKAVLEILPVFADKGRAVSRFLPLHPYRDRCPIYAGDDLTDETAFAVVQAAGGLAIRIGRQSYAPTDLCLDTPKAFRRWLMQWANTGSIPHH